MRNFVQEGRSLDFTAPAGGVQAGVPVLIGNTLCVPATDAAEGETFVGWLQGVYDVSAAGAANGQAWGQGQTLYWDNAAKVFTLTAAGNTKAAVAALPKASPAVAGRIRLVPSL
jgi:predicted RecA/RadA family phage recombinase